MQLGEFLVLRGCLGNVIRMFISASAHARFYKDLHGEMLNKRRF